MKHIFDPKTAWRLMLIQKLPCILCGRLTMNRGEFIPNDPREFGVGLPPPGKTRVVLYPLCENHPRDEDDMNKIEIRLGRKV